MFLRRIYTKDGKLRYGSHTGQEHHPPQHMIVGTTRTKIILVSAHLITCPWIRWVGGDHWGWRLRSRSLPRLQHLGLRTMSGWLWPVPIDVDEGDPSVFDWSQWSNHSIPRCRWLRIHTSLFHIESLLPRFFHSAVSRSIDVYEDCNSCCEGIMSSTHSRRWSMRNYCVPSLHHRTWC